MRSARADGSCFAGAFCRAERTRSASEVVAHPQCGPRLERARVRRVRGSSVLRAVAGGWVDTAECPADEVLAEGEVGVLLEGVVDEEGGSCPVPERSVARHVVGVEDQFGLCADPDLLVRGDDGLDFGGCEGAELVPVENAGVQCGVVEDLLPCVAAADEDDGGSACVVAPQGAEVLQGLGLEALHFVDEQDAWLCFASGEPLEQDEERAVRSKLTHGRNPTDPLLHVNFAVLALEGGVRTRSGKPYRPGPGFLYDWRTAAVRPLLEQAIAQVGIQPRWGRQADLVARADGTATVPWTLPITQDGLARLLGHIRTACILTIAALSGMRTSELVELPLDCQLAPRSYGTDRVRHRLKSRVIKGRGHGGTWDEWVVVAEAYEAAGVACQLADPGATHLFPVHLDLCRRYRDLRAWVNSDEGQRLGLPRLPDDAITPRILRRTLAVELAHRPGGLFAAKLQLKHLSVTTTEGYANRPGGAQALFLAEVGKEEESRNLSLTLRAFRDDQAGRRPSGPGARDLLAFFAGVERQLEELDVTAPVVKRSDQEVINLLAHRSGALHLGLANYCWFLDPDKALCLKLADSSDRSRPLVGMCDSARCPQATHHSCHREAWATAAVSGRAFISKIGRGQKTERARLVAEVERAEYIVAAIDAAAHGGPRGTDQ